jgi:Na+-transporting NADH:ubiquinone oxidoreductase subunit A
MKKISIKHTYDIQLSGKPSQEVKTVAGNKFVAVLPSSIDLIKPKLVVKQGDSVKIGSKLFFDKVNPDIYFLSPGAGVISTITYGPKRRLDEVIIELSEEETSESLGIMTSDEVAASSREDIVAKLQAGGLWPALTEYPFKNIPKLTTVPPSIYVSLDNDEPYMPESSVLLKEKKEAFLFGLAIIKKLSDTVFVTVSDKNNTVKTMLGNVITHQINGDYPANNPAVVLYHNKKSSDENASWSIKCQDVLRIASLFETGTYPIEKTIVLAGSLATDPCHIKTREGVSVAELLGDFLEYEPTRYIAGGVFTGRQITDNGYLGYYDQALHLIREGKAPEMLTFFRPGFDKPTFSKTYLSALLNKSDWTMNTSINGGYRSCISCGECPKVCPVDILPQLLMKSIYAKEMEESLSLGLLDCADCGLCTYICPSKIDLDSTFKDEKNRLAKDVL